jgi:hypothetical protein
MQVPKLSFNWLRRISFHCLSSASNFHKHQNIRGHKSQLNVLPTKLRPVKIEDENDNDNDFKISEESEENIIINLNKLSKMISAFLPHESVLFVTFSISCHISHWIFKI